MSEEMNRDMQHGSREYKYRRLRGRAVWKITGWIVLVLGTLLIVSRALTVSYLVFAKGYWGWIKEPNQLVTLAFCIVLLVWAIVFLRSAGSQAIAVERKLVRATFLTSAPYCLGYAVVGVGMLSFDEGAFFVLGSFFISALFLVSALCAMRKRLHAASVLMLVGGVFAPPFGLVAILTAVPVRMTLKERVT